MLARRGAVVVEPSALRRMDRLDTVVLDAEALTTGVLMLGDLLALPGADGTADALDELVPRVHELFDPEDATAPRRLSADGEHWLLTGLDDIPGGDDPRAVEAGEALRADGATHVLGLRRDDRLTAVVGVLPEPASAAEALAAAARRAGLTLVLGDSEGTGPGIADRAVPGGEALRNSVRALQAAGSGVLVVSRDRQALAAADLGIGVSRADGVAPWGAHVLVGDDLGTAALLIEGVKVARGVSSRSVNLARAGTVLGTIMATAGTAPRGPGLAGLAVNGAAAVSLGNGAWSATELGRRVVVPGVSRTPWHVMPTSTVLARLDVTEGGLTSAEAHRRQRDDPAAAETETSLGRAFLDELNNPLTPVLAGGAVLSAAIGAVVDAAIVVGVTAFSALIGGVQRVATDRAVAGLLERSSIRARVVRDGTSRGVGADEVVVGDIIDLGPDDVVPADCRVLDSDGLEIDESSLTGESLPVPKSPLPVIARTVADRRSMLYEGSTVATGRGRAVVVATGSSTEVGRSTAAARAAAPVAGVDERLAGLTSVTTPLAIASAGAVVLAGAVRGLPFQQNLHSGVGLAVASVPEGLPFVVSAAQLASARRLSAEGALVRNPKTIEAVGRTDVLCFDKTGTLTEGRLALSAISDGIKLRPTDRLRKRQRRVLAAALRATPRPAPGERLAHLTDRAVVYGGQQFDVDPAHKRPGWWPVASLDFDPSRGYHATLGEVDDPQEDGGPLRLISVKGAPEVVIARATSWAGTPLDDEARQRLVEHTELLAGQGMRVLAVAERELTADQHAARAAGRDTDGADDNTLDDADVADLEFTGFVGFTDPVRAGSQATVRDLRDAGVQVVMITGDHPSTAEAVAEELDVLNGGIVVTGTELDALDDDALDELIPRVRVIARGTPSHKVRAVQAFQRLGRTVAMTGDGANDAPGDPARRRGHRAGPPRHARRPRRGGPRHHRRPPGDDPRGARRGPGDVGVGARGARRARRRQPRRDRVHRARGGDHGHVAAQRPPAAAGQPAHRPGALAGARGARARARVGGRAAGRGAGRVAGRGPQPRDRAAGHGHRGRREPRVAGGPDHPVRQPGPLAHRGAHGARRHPARPDRRRRRRSQPDGHRRRRRLRGRAVRGGADPGRQPVLRLHAARPDRLGAGRRIGHRRHRGLGGRTGAGAPVRSGRSCPRDRRRRRGSPASRRSATRPPGGTSSCRTVRRLR